MLLSLRHYLLSPNKFSLFVANSIQFFLFLFSEKPNLPFISLHHRYTVYLSISVSLPLALSFSLFYFLLSYSTSTKFYISTFKFEKLFAIFSLLSLLTRHRVNILIVRRNSRTIQMPKMILKKNETILRIQEEKRLKMFPTGEKHSQIMKEFRIPVLCLFNASYLQHENGICQQQNHIDILIHIIFFLLCLCFFFHSNCSFKLIYSKNCM